MLFGLFFEIFATISMQQFEPGKFMAKSPHKVVSHAADAITATTYAKAVLDGRSLTDPGSTTLPTCAQFTINEFYDQYRNGVLVHNTHTATGERYITFIVGVWAELQPKLDEILNGFRNSYKQAYLQVGSAPTQSNLPPPLASVTIPTRSQPMSLQDRASFQQMQRIQASLKSGNREKSTFSALRIIRRELRAAVESLEEALSTLNLAVPAAVTAKKHPLVEEQEKWRQICSGCANLCHYYQLRIYSLNTFVSVNKYYSEDMGWGNYEIPLTLQSKVTSAMHLAANAFFQEHLRPLCVSDDVGVTIDGQFKIDCHKMAQYILSRYNAILAEQKARQQEIDAFDAAQAKLRLAAQDKEKTAHDDKKCELERQIFEAKSVYNYMIPIINALLMKYDGQFDPQQSGFTELYSLS